MRPIFTSPRFVLPFMILLALVTAGVRAGDLWQAASSGALFSPVKPALAAAPEHAAEEKSAEHAKSEPPKEAAPSEIKSDAPSARTAEEPPTGPENALYKQVAGRREQLDAREKALTAREALIKVGEERIDQKLSEMKTLRAQLETLLGQASAAQVTQLTNLVKIYETMKPKEAARIFETLDLPVLMQVVQRMKPARTAAVMAEMDPLKAKAITVALTNQDKLPELQ